MHYASRKSGFPAFRHGVPLAIYKKLFDKLKGSDKMKKYGLTDYQIESAKNKLQFNTEYMKSNGIQLDNKFVPYADFVANSYINSDRYVAELQHRAWSIYEYAQERKLKNIFFTLTLPSKWHAKKTFKNKLVNNPKFAGRKYICTINKIKFINAHVVQKVPYIESELDFSQTVDKYTPRNASKELTKMLSKLLKDRSYTDIDKSDKCFFRVTEPHKDGTPHLHISLFVLEKYVERIVKALNRFYPAPMGDIETNVKSPVKYLMKYVLKTLDDLREEGSSTTNLTLWYLYHGISRFYTSRTFISLEIYRKLNGMYTLRDLTASYNDELISVQIDPETKEIKHIEDEHGIIYTAKPINWFEKLFQADYDDADLNKFEPLPEPKEAKPIDIIIDGEEFVYYKGTVSKYNKKPYQMNDFELYQYFQSLDIDTVDDKHYIYTRNLLIERGYVVGERLKLTAIEDMQREFECEEIF